MATVFPFSAIVGQDEMKLALLIAAVDPKVGGVLAFGDRGAGKSTAVRALAALLPKMKVVVGCRYNCDPGQPEKFCDECKDKQAHGKLKSAGHNSLHNRWSIVSVVRVEPYTAC
jgi:magnesium chelatase subunit I